MPMTPEELERRRQIVGASEAALLFGLPCFGRTLGDLWFEKKYGTVKNRESPAMSLGTKLEPLVLEYAENRLGHPIVSRQEWVKRDAVAATLDGRLTTGPVVEAKTAGILSPKFQNEEWGDDGTDEIPEVYLVQLQAQLFVTGAELGYLAALIGGRGFCMFQSEPHAELQAAISAKAEAFIRSLQNDEPPDELPQLDTLKRIRRQPAKVLERSDALDELWLKLEEAKATAKESDESKETLQRQLLAMLGDAEAAETRNGLITYYEQSRKESVTAASTFRVLRFKRGG